MAPKVHAFLGFSSAGHWGLCPIYPHVAKAYPQPGGIEADEGTAAHEVVELVTEGKPIPEYASNGIKITQEMRDGAELWMKTVAPSLGENVHIEETIPVKRVHDSLCFGTPDYWSYSQGQGIIHVVEYKFGRRHVPAFRNKQLILQMAGAMEKLGVTGASDQYVRVKLEVVQPRWYGYQGPISTWECMASDLRAEVNALEMAAAEATQVLPEGIQRRAVPGVDQCYKCPGRIMGRCPALAQATAIVTDYASMASEMRDMTTEQACFELKHLNRMSNILHHRIEGLQEQVLMAAESGERTPFFRSADKQGRASWEGFSVEEVVRLGDILGVNLRKESVVTPAQARKLGVTDELINAVSGRKVERVLIERSEQEALSKINLK